jgi:hypothetical protein
MKHMNQYCLLFCCIVAPLTTLKANADKVFFVDSPAKSLEVHTNDNQDSPVIYYAAHQTPLITSAQGGAYTKWYDVKTLNGKTGYALWEFLKSYPEEEISATVWNSYSEASRSKFLRQLRDVSRAIKPGFPELAMKAYPTIGPWQCDPNFGGWGANYTRTFDSISKAMTWVLNLKKALQEAFGGTWRESLASIELTTDERDKAVKEPFARIWALRVAGRGYKLVFVINGAAD